MQAAKLQKRVQPDKAMLYLYLLWTSCDGLEFSYIAFPPNPPSCHSLQKCPCQFSEVVNRRSTGVPTTPINENMARPMLPRNSPTTFSSRCTYKIVGFSFTQRRKKL